MFNKEKFEKAVEEVKFVCAVNEEPMGASPDNQRMAQVIMDGFTKKHGVDFHQLKKIVGCFSE